MTVIVDSSRLAFHEAELAEFAVRLGAKRLQVRDITDVEPTIGMGYQDSDDKWRGEGRTYYVRGAPKFLVDIDVLLSSEQRAELQLMLGGYIVQEYPTKRNLELEAWRL